jgi:hypothetical protein
MRIFSFSRVIELSKLAQTISFVKNIYDQMQSDRYVLNIRDYYFIAYVCRVGILDRVERNGWYLPTLRIYTNINGVSRIIFYPEAYAMTIGRLLKKVSDLDDEDTYNEISSILEKEEEFFNYEKYHLPELEEVVKKIIYK